MPYIAQRDFYEKIVEQFSKLPLPAGALNYLITKLLLATHPKTYADYNNLIGVLECTKLEFYRRAITPYEDKKRQENGDVY